MARRSGVRFANSTRPRRLGLESRCNRITRALAFAVLVPALCAVWGAAPERGWLDRGYPVAKLDGKRIFLSELTRANTDVSGLKDRDGNSRLDSAAADSLLRRFNEGLAKHLRSRLSKAQVQPGSVPSPSLTLIKSYGDPRIPDSLSFQTPTSGGFAKLGFQGEISILLGRTVFGTRSILAAKPSRFRGGVPGVPGHMGIPGHPAHFVPDFDAFDFPKDDGEIDTSVAVTKKKAFYSIVEFCFYDHAAGQAFGYGIDAVETKYHGMLLEVFSGGKVDAGGHMEKMARNLTDLLLRSDASLVKKYAKTELEPPAKASVVKEEIREILDTEEE
jgi:hypothetical protein